MGIKELWSHIVGIPFANNLFEIPILYTLIIVFALSCFIYYFQRKNIEWIIVKVTYLIIVIEWLFFPIVLNGSGIDGKMFVFNFNFISSLMINPMHVIGHFILFIPLGFYIYSFLEIKKKYVMISSVSIVAFIEIIRVVINYMTNYVQFRVEVMDMLLHLIGIAVGVLIYFIRQTTLWSNIIHFLDTY